MLMLKLLILWAPVALCQAFQQSQEPLVVQHLDDEYGPNTASAIANGPLVFNTIYSAVRQWGSTIQHNGMSLFPAYVPEGTLVYHGSLKKEPPKDFEWLAFEIPHAELFSTGFRYKGEDGIHVPGKVIEPRTSPLAMQLALNHTSDHKELVFVPGYLQTYRANRPLKLLYLDGMAAGKSTRGTLDMQDLVLLNSTISPWDDFERGRQLCSLAKGWGFDGIARTECGTEIIKCDFSDGLDFISATHRADMGWPESVDDTFFLTFVRDVASRYPGIDSGRVTVDYSSIVSAFFYTTNLSNPTTDPGQKRLPRLVNANEQTLRRIRHDGREAFRNSRPSDIIDWQGVADMIVKRYAARLQLLVSGLSPRTFLSEINQMVNMYIDYSRSMEQDSVQNCMMHYLQPIQPQSKQDHLLQGSFKAVTGKICHTLFKARARLVKRSAAEGLDNLKDVEFETALITHLMEWLDWVEWKSCGPCAVDEVCFVAFFPMGTVDDHYNPKCLNNAALQDTFFPVENGYWLDDFPK